jgi:hypothetical protein
MPDGVSCFLKVGYGFCHSDLTVNDVALLQQTEVLMRVCRMEISVASG